MKNSECLVSVVIPCFNAEQTLANAVESVQAQNYDNSEILIVDDQSTDGSVELANSLAAQFANIKVLVQTKNAGPAAARNRGLCHASGRHICFLDADDEYAPGFFAEVLPLLEADPELSGVITGIELVNCHREVHPAQLDAMVNSLPSNVMIRKHTADLMNGFPEGPEFRGKAAGEDMVFKNLLKTYFKVTYCSEKYLRYSVKPGSHFDHFINRSRVVDGKVVFTKLTSEEQSGNMAEARKRYVDQALQRLAAQNSRPGAFPDSQTIRINTNNHSYMLHYPNSPAMRKTIQEICGGEYGFPQCLESDTGAILDIGANIGCATLLLRSSYPNTTIYACEPWGEFRKGVKGRWRR